MADLERIMIPLNQIGDSKSRWSTAALKWPGFRLLEVRASDEGRSIPFRCEGQEIILEDVGNLRPTALVEIEHPQDIESAKLDLERAKTKTEDLWRTRTYVFSIGSAVLTAVVAISVALIGAPSSKGLPVNIDAVQSCEDSLQRLSTLTQIPNQTVGGLSSAIHSHVDTCDGMLQGVIRAAAKKDSK